MDEQTYQIVLSPDLGILPEEFAKAWNETAQARAIAEARLVESKGTQFDPTLIAGILIGVATNVASSALYDLIKEVIRRLQDRQGTHPGTHTHIEELHKPDGTRLVVVDIDEK
jgi:hypothetical protein